MFTQSFRGFRILKALLACVISVTMILSPELSYAQALLLPAPGTMVQTSSAYVPVIMRGVTVHADNPFLFDFILDTGNSGLKPGTRDNAVIKEESQKMIEYFLASMTIPEKDQWVNLSPYEKDRILTKELGKTALGRDMLAQDYLLKQVTAAMIYPDKDLGKAFWKRVYDRAQAEFGSIDIPMDSFNKVWIIADRAAVYTHKDPKKAGQLTAVVTDAHLKVMLESDYVAIQNNSDAVSADAVKASTPTQEMSKQIIREIVIPELEKEVNTGKNFASLRQIYQAVILATWYKRNLKDALLTSVYADHGMTNGVEGAWVANKGADVDPNQIWDRYVEAYKKGAFNLVKEDVNQATGETVPHKYFSGGVVATLGPIKEGNRSNVTGAMGVLFVARAPMGDSKGNNRVVRTSQQEELARKLREEPFSIEATTTEGRFDLIFTAEGKAVLTIVKGKKDGEWNLDLMGSDETMRLTGVFLGTARPTPAEALKALDYAEKVAVPVLDVQGLDAQELRDLEGAKQTIEAILKRQFESEAITEIVYRIALANTYKNFYEWTTDPDIFRIDPNIRVANLEAIRDGRWNQIIDAYRQDVPFGTAGIRGKAVLTKAELEVFAKDGPFAKFLKGPNTINMFRLLKMNAGVLDNMKAKGQKVVLIGYDSRIGGALFAEMIARLAIAKSTPEHQFKIFLFDRVAPFPEVSYGITLTALREAHVRLKKENFTDGDDWKDVFKKLVDNGWAKLTADDKEIELTVDLEKEQGRMEEVFGKQKLQWKVLPALLVAAKGIFLSASHNPADYNGDKMVDETGAQLNQKAKNETVAAIDAVKNADIVPATSLADAKPGQIVWLSAKDPVPGKDYYGFERFDLQSLYLDQLVRQVENPELLAKHVAGLRIGYGAFNGAGAEFAPELQRRLGVTESNLLVVQSMQQPDGRYPLFAYGEQPDPGDPIAATLLRRELIKEYGQEAADLLDIIFGTDPDDDRLGATVPVLRAQQKWFGNYRLLSANDAWTLALWNIFNTKKAMGNLKKPGEHTFITTHVTTDALEAVAKLFGVEPSGQLLDMNDQPATNNSYQNSLKRVWTGFTYLAGTAVKLQKEGKVFPDFMAEESNGLSKGGHTSEKDGNLAIIFLIEVLAYAKSQGITIFELLDRIYALIGHYATANKPLPRTGAFEGVEGFSEKITIIQMTQTWAKMANERAGTADPFMIAGREVVGAVEFTSGRLDKTHYPGVPDEGVRFFFKDPTLPHGAPVTDSKKYITIRTSGTAQTLRFYGQGYTAEYDPETKARNYQETEQTVLMAQMQILQDTGLTQKYGAMVLKQLMELQYTPLEREVDSPVTTLRAADLQGLTGVTEGNNKVYTFKNSWVLKVALTSSPEAQGKINVSLSTGADLPERNAAFVQFTNTNTALAEGLRDLTAPIAERIVTDNKALEAVLKALGVNIDGMVAELPGVEKRNDNAQGGIDFNASKALSTSGDKISFSFDQDMVDRFKKGDFSGIMPVITNIILIPGWAPILGFEPKAVVQPESA